MTRKRVAIIAVMLCVTAVSGRALGQDRIRNYFNDAACEVKKAEEPAQKRAILERDISRMLTGLEKVRESSLVGESDLEGIDRTRESLKEKLDELKGENGYERVSDGRLDAFADYLVQDMEQADRAITISVTTLLLIIIILLLI